MMDKARLLAMTTDIVSSHATRTEMNRETLVLEIAHVFAKLASLAGAEGEVEIVIEKVEATDMKPAVPLEAAFGADQVFCMVCGAGMRTLKRHLMTAHQMTPRQYRRQFGIPAGMALVARSYSEAKKKLALDLNLAGGLAKARAAKGKKTVEEPVAVVAEGKVKVIRRRAKKAEA